MNTNLMVCTAVVDSMGEAVGQHLSDDRHRNLRRLGSFCADNLASPPDVLQYVILTHPKKIIDVILIQLHIKEGEFLIRCKYGCLQSDRMCVSEKILTRIIEALAIDKPIPFQNDRTSISSLRYSSG